VARRSLIAHDFVGEWMDAGTIESLLAANEFAARFAGERPIDASGRLAEVDAEPVDPESVRP
jgi:hypothetical protein